MPNNQHQKDLDDNSTRGAWRIERKVPLAIIVLIVVQTVAGIWSMSRMVGEVEQLKDQIAEFKAERYTREDARRDKELWQTVVQAIQQANQERDRRLNSLEAWIERNRGLLTR